MCRISGGSRRKGAESVLRLIQLHANQLFTHIAEIKGQAPPDCIFIRQLVSAGHWSGRQGIV